MMIVSTTSPARRVSKRLGALQESATLAVDAKAKALKAAGRPVIGFGAGEPDFPTPENIVEAAVRAARDPKSHRYSPAKGQPALREAESCVHFDAFDGEFGGEFTRQKLSIERGAQIVVLGKHDLWHPCERLE